MNASIGDGLGDQIGSEQRLGEIESTIYSSLSDKTLKVKAPVIQKRCDTRKKTENTRFRPIKGPLVVECNVKKDSMTSINNTDDKISANHNKNYRISRSSTPIIEDKKVATKCLYSPYIFDSEKAAQS